MKEILAIYHGNCDDGIGAAMAINTADTTELGGPVTFVAGKYHDPIDPTIATDKAVVFVDFSYKRAVMKAICDVANSVLVIDHHKSAAADLAGLDAECANLKLHFDMTKSGAVLAWEFFHPGEALPLFYQYLQARDLWRLDSLPNVREFSNGLRSFPQNMHYWERYLSNVATEALIEEGHAITRFIDLKCEQAYEHRHPIQIAGHITVAVNVPYFLASDMADYILRQNPDMAYAATYFHLDNGRVQFSLRSRENFDVQSIATQFNGGGHAQAAGFTADVVFPLTLQGKSA